MSNTRDDAGKTPAPKNPESYRKPTVSVANYLDPDQIALTAALEIDKIVLGRASSTTRTAQIQVVIRAVLDQARGGVFIPSTGKEDDQKMRTFTQPKENPSDLGLVSEVELAAALKVTTQALAVWRAADEGPVYTRLGRSIYYKRSDIDDWINGNRSA